MPSEGERLQKVMAQAGVASRRASEAMILAGRVSVNGQVVTTLGTRVVAGVDRIAVDGVPLGPAEALVYLAVYKPVGYLSSSDDPHGGEMVTDLVPQQVRVYPVGRLDRNSEGLMLLTNDGELALRIMHPRYAHDKEYRVLIEGDLTREEAERLETGIPIEDKSEPARARLVSLSRDWRWRDDPRRAGTRWIGLVLQEGHKRQIREMLSALGIRLLRLIRVRIGTLELGSLEPGGYRYLTDSEVTSLRRLTGLEGRPAERESAS